MRKHFCDLCKAEMDGGLSGSGQMTAGEEMGLCIMVGIDRPRQPNSPDDVCARCIAKALRRAADKLDT